MTTEILLKNEGIELFAPLPFEECRVINDRLLQRLEFVPRSVLMLIIPYFAGTPEGNLSLYARSKDYHLYAKELWERLSPSLSSLYPQNRFALFSDHSPIDERHAAALAGLGCIGDHGLLITEKYGSFVFLCEILSDLDPSVLPKTDMAQEHRDLCLHCGSCKKACPCHFESCASGIGQKKGELTPEEEALVLKTKLLWGCDLCQTSCPLNKRVQKTDIPFFYEERIESLTPEILEGLQGDAFKERAFAWRGRKTVERNMAIFEEARNAKQE
ncbi:MAG: epoxyqueuosine reductase [Clostridia bacterium]|nr:epoxyqueuosine reductase [Clostridia bacterium]